MPKKVKPSSSLREPKSGSQYFENLKRVPSLLIDDQPMKDNSSSNYDPVDFCIRIDDRLYALASLNINRETKEVFIKLYYEQEFRGIGQMCIYEIGDTSRHGSTDHISFHKDGAVHLTAKKYRGKVHRRIAASVEGGIFDLPDKEVVPFLFLSFVLTDNDYRWPLKHRSPRCHV